MFTVDALRKPNQVAAEATATLTLHEPLGYAVVLDEGLRALGESRGSLFSYGVRQDGRRMDPSSTEPLIGEVVVYAHRD